MDIPPQNPAANKWKPPEYFEEYRLRRRVGRGGFGEVYLGHDLLLDRPVAIKFISAAQPDSRMRDRFLSEMGTKSSRRRIVDAQQAGTMQENISDWEGREETQESAG